MQNQESCILYNRGTTKSYLKLEKDTRQSDPISTYTYL